jgi:putative lipoic acid-binding regulatory protein
MSKPNPEAAIDALHIEERESALTFPCVFPIKVMGRTQDGFAQAVSEVVRKHAPDFDPAALEMRASKEGNWLSVTATVNATSREQLDDLYRELVAHPMVKMVL